MPVTEVFRESTRHPVNSSGLKEGDSVVYSSLWGIKPYEFQGKILRLFENGMVEVKFETKNGKPYSTHYLEYVSLKRLKAVPTISPGVNPNPPGVNVVDEKSHKYLALASVERGLMQPDVSYLSLLDEAVDQRAMQVCQARGRKGLAAEPKAAPLVKEEITYLASNQGVSEVLDPFVAPWAFGRKPKFSQMDLLRDGVAGGSIFDASLFLFGHGYLTLLGAVSGTLFISPLYLNRPRSINHNKERAAKGKHVSKRMAFWKDSVPSLVFTELYCTDNEAEVLHLSPQRSLGIEKLSIAQLSELAQAVQEAGPELKIFYEESNLDKGKSRK